VGQRGKGVRPVEPFRVDPGVVFAVDTRERVVAITIDDGPSAATPGILEVLDEHGARATFFLIGSRIEACPELAAQIVEAGHELGHHMMEDRPSRDLSDEEFARRFDRMDRILDDLGGSRWFRPGSGWYDNNMVQTAAERGYRTVLGSVYPYDAHIPWTGFLSWYVRQHTAPGSIVVLHDGPGRGVRTAEALRSVLSDLDRRWYRAVTLTELMELAADPAG
jgi:peptidoglycan-N-acetylglucosamine deacetylase